MHLRTTDQREAGGPVSAWPLPISAAFVTKKKAPEGALKVCGPCIGGCGEAGRYEAATQVRGVGFSLAGDLPHPSGLVGQRRPPLNVLRTPVPGSSGLASVSR